MILSLSQQKTLEVSLMIVGIYIRVSTTEQAEEGYSIAAQKERLIAYCKAQGWNEYKLYVDEGVSAKDTNRPKLQLLLKDVEDGKINLILVYRLDRFTRRVRDLHNMLDFMENHDCKFRSATEMYDTTTAMGRMFIGLVALLAQWEAENMSERIKMALDKKVSDGERVGNIPYGFDLSEDEKLIKNEKGQTLLWMVEKIENGWSINKTANELLLFNNDRNWSAEKIIRLLRNPAIYGSTRWNEKVIEGTHEGYITKERWLRLQQKMDDRTIHFRKDLKVSYIFHGVLVCPNCSNMLIANRFSNKRRDGSEHTGFVYRCNYCYKNKIKSYSPAERYFERALITYMKNVTFDNIEIEEKENENYNELSKQMEKIKRMREKYQRAWASDNMTDEEFEERMNETKHLLDGIESQINKLDVQPKIDIDRLKQISYTFEDSFYKLDREAKKEFIQRFIRKIEFEYITVPPKHKRYKTARPEIVFKNIEFY